MRRILIVLVFCCLLATGCSDKPDDTIAMTSAHRYEPATLTVHVGQQVTWVNDSSEAHSVTAYQDSLPPGAEYFSSSGAASEKQARAHITDLLTNGDTFSFKFDVAGTYEYFCIPHEAQGMKGKIVVEN